MGKKGADLETVEKTSNEDVLDAILKQTEALQELTKVVAKLNAEWEKWRKAGKF